MSQTSQPKSHAVLVMGLLLGAACVVYLPFVYRNSAGEWDTYRMLIGMVEQIRGASPLHMFNYQISFGYYFFVSLFYPLFETNLVGLIAFINYFNAVSAILFVIPFFLVVQRYWGIQAAIWANLLLFFIPVWWHVGLYGHPMIPAILLFFIGLALVSYDADLATGNIIRWFMLAGVTVVVMTVAITFRQDIVLLFPLITASLLLNKKSWAKVIGQSAVYGLVPCVLFYVVRYPLIPAQEVSVLQRLMAFHNPLQNNLVDGFVIMVLAYHPLYLGVLGVITLVLLYQRRYLWVAFIGTFFIQAVFWIMNPTPARHFVYGSPILALGVTLGFQTLMAYYPKLKVSWVVPLFILGSFVSLEMAYPNLSANYPWKHDPLPFSVRAPFRSMFLNKYYTEQYFERAQQFGSDLYQLAPQDDTIVVVADSLPVLWSLQIASQETSVRRESIGSGSEAWELYWLQTENNQFVFPDRLLLPMHELESIVNQADPSRTYQFQLDPHNDTYHEAVTTPPGPFHKSQ